MAAVYTHGHHESVLRSHRWRTVHNSAAYLLPHLHSGMTLLDVGCGPGTITADFAALVAPGQATALEHTADALALAEEELSRRGVSNVTFATGDVHALDFADDTFDVVHAHQVLQHVTDPAQALREMRRVCKPDGLVAARDGDYDGFSWHPRLPELDEWHALYFELATRNGGDPRAGARLLHYAQAAGFTDITASSSTWCFATPTDREFWGGMWAERILESRVAGQAMDAGLAGRADLERMAEGWRRWVAAPDGWLSVTHGEILARG
jgi:ubiquinone/menaquinone biosynthesis C-methylase UbiE